MRTCAPATGFFDPSVTVPEILPVCASAIAGTTAIIAIIAAPRIAREIIVRNIIKLLL
jgi:hypothetical protein